MNWQRSGELGMVKEPYRVGKYFLEGVTRYGLFCGYESLGYFKTFEEAQQAAEHHAGVKQVMEGRT